MKYFLVLIALTFSVLSNASSTRELYEGCTQAKYWYDANSPSVSLSKVGEKCIYYMQGFEAGAVANAIDSCVKFACKEKENPYKLHCGHKYDATTYEHISAFISWVGDNPKVMNMEPHLVIALALRDKFPCD